MVDSDLTRSNGVKLRNTHPTLYRSIMALALVSVALAVNFWTSNPTFNPYGIDKNVVGFVFLVLGVGQLVFLNVLHNLRLIRIGLAASVGWLLFWGASNTQQVFAGKASFQLPILLVGLAVLQIFLLIESPVNPMTRRDNGPEP